MTVAIHPMQIGFVGEISGIDITRSLSRDEVAAIEAGMDRYAVLEFHGQKLTDQQPQAFSRYFGKLEHTAGSNITKAQDRRLDPYMADVSNLNKDHRPLARDDRKRMFNLGNRL
jgi:alpha-ketoglutarate-dependent 2,4-dichlorophenoxyacetate dioxygenase